MKNFKPGQCCRCGSTNVAISNDDKVFCLDCGDWEWLEDAVDSSWNGYVIEDKLNQTANNNETNI